MLWPCKCFLLLFFAVSGAAQTMEQMKAFLINEYLSAITAYGPGVGVFAPYYYADISYNDLPFVGKIPSLGKEGTSSRLGISPFYPGSGNPGDPGPILYRANPLPPHVPEPVDVVAVPLDEEALHGEQLFPKELTLPWEKAPEENVEIEEEGKKGIHQPFEEVIPEGMVSWPGKEKEIEGKIDESLFSSSKEGKTKTKTSTEPIVPPNPFRRLRASRKLFSALS